MADNEKPADSNEPWMQFTDHKAQVEAEQLAAQCASAVSTMATGFQPIREATIGYRNNLLAEGFSATAAESAALEFHSFLTAQLRSGIST